jgi:hypothetical protein
LSFDTVGKWKLTHFVSDLFCLGFENAYMLIFRLCLLAKVMFEGFVEYKRREYCNDVKCPVQMELNKQSEGSEKYEKIRKTCVLGCLFSTYQFHHWLIDKGYLIVKPV